MVKIIEAGMPGTCGLCSKEYAAGTRILKDPKTNKWVEADCYFPSHTRNNANPRTHQTAEGGNLSPTDSKGDEEGDSEIEDECSCMLECPVPSLDALPVL